MSLGTPAVLAVPREEQPTTTPTPTKLLALSNGRTLRLLYDRNYQQGNNANGNNLHCTRVTKTERHGGVVVEEAQKHKVNTTRRSQEEEEEEVSEKSTGAVFCSFKLDRKGYFPPTAMRKEKNRTTTTTQTHKLEGDYDLHQPEDPGSSQQQQQQCRSSSNQYQVIAMEVDRQFNALEQPSQNSYDGTYSFGTAHTSHAVMFPGKRTRPRTQYNSEDSETRLLSLAPVFLQQVIQENPSMSPEHARRVSGLVLEFYLSDEASATHHTCRRLSERIEGQHGGVRDWVKFAESELREDSELD